MSPNNSDISKDFLQLARLALTGRQQDVQLLIHRASKKHKIDNPELSAALVALLSESPTRSTPLRKHAETPLPVDIDSRLQLLRLEKSVPEHDIVLDAELQASLDQILSERKNQAALLRHGLQPTKSILFTGPPGVGKTMAAKWIAQKLDRPLLVLDLAAVMSSYLGRTGNNIRFVLDYAKNTECVLLIDELDAIAKRRDDNSEIGELKRLVTVLLQEIDDWPSSGILVAATNHPDLLDPAVWRRFEVVLKFNNPAQTMVEKYINMLLHEHIDNSSTYSKILSYVLSGRSFSEVEKQITLIRRAVALSGESIVSQIERLIQDSSHLTRDQKVDLACSLVDNNIMSQRQAHELTGIARETIRKNSKK